MNAVGSSLCFGMKWGPDDADLMVLGRGHVPVSLMQQQIIACQEY